MSFLKMQQLIILISVQISRNLKKRLLDWIDIYFDEDKSQASDWNFLNKQLFGSPPPPQEGRRSRPTTTPPEGTSHNACSSTSQKPPFQMAGPREFAPGGATPRTLKAVSSPARPPSRRREYGRSCCAPCNRPRSPPRRPAPAPGTHRSS